jgi:DNA-directed RNA polymerase subunit RPC12/RpoP
MAPVLRPVIKKEKDLLQEEEETLNMRKESYDLIRDELTRRDKEVEQKEVRLIKTELDLLQQRELLEVEKDELRIKIDKFNLHAKKWNSMEERVKNLNLIIKKLEKKRDETDEAFLYAQINFNAIFHRLEKISNICSICGKKFGKKQEKDEHFRSEHVKNVALRSELEEEVIEEELFKKMHVQNSEEKMEVEVKLFNICATCGRNFASDTEREIHFKNEHANNLTLQRALQEELEPECIIKEDFEFALEDYYKPMQMQRVNLEEIEPTPSTSTSTKGEKSKPVQQRIASNKFEKKIEPLISHKVILRKRKL